MAVVRFVKNSTILYNNHFRIIVDKGGDMNIAASHVGTNVTIIMY